MRKNVSLPVIFCLFYAFCLQAILAETITLTNPLIKQRADPFILRHTDGYYYFTATVPAYDLIELRRAPTIPALASAAPTVIWRKHASGIMGAHIWAPELHYISGKWYIYFAAGSTSNVWAIRIFILENTSANPIQGTWVEKGELQPALNAFSLDATTFDHNGTRYLIFAMADASVNNESCLFIASMSNPWTLSSAPVRITKPEYTWERAGIPVNEGGAVIKRNGRIFIAYSAAKTDASYCVGLLTASDTANLLNAGSWNKAAIPVFKSGNNVWGPGHNQFTVSQDGATDILVYHGRDYEAISGDPLNDPNRHTRIQKLNWHTDGTPDFGVPAANGTISFGNPTATPATATPTRTSTATVARGDVDGNGAINIVDALMTAQFSVGLNPAGFMQANADANCDGQITIVDALMIAQRYVGLLAGFSC